MLAKYDTSFLTTDQNVHSVSFIFCSFTLRTLQLFLWEKDWSLVSHSVEV